jgi:hypothetical protein
MKPMEVKEKNQRQKRKGGGGGKAIKKLNGKGAKRQ